MDKALILKAAIPAFLLPTVAQAAPAVPVLGAIGGALGLTGAAAIAVGAVAVAAVGYVAVKAVGSALTGAFAPDIPSYDAGNINQEQAIEGVKLTKQGTNEDIPVVYGHRRIGGKIIFAETHGSTDDVTNRYLTVVYALCEGEIARINSVFVDDVQISGITNPAFGTQHNVSSGRYSGRLSMQLFAGTDSQGQSSLANQAPSWNDKTRKLPGIAYAVMRYEWKHIEDNEDAENNPYGGGIPNVMFDVIGKKVYDVATHGSDVADLSNDYADLSKGISYNPVNHLLDYLMNPVYGANVPKEEIDARYFHIAANKLNQLIDYDENNTQDGPAMTGNTVLNTRDKVINNVKTLLQGCRGFLPYSRGRYKVRIDDGGNKLDITSSTVEIALDITEDNMLYGASLTGESKNQKYNQVIVKFIDPDNNFTQQEVVFPAQSSSTYTTAYAEDNNEELVGTFLYPTVTNKSIAENLARTIFYKSRNQRYITFSGTPELLELEVGDIIRITSTVFNLSQQTFRVTKLNVNADATINVEAREHDATIFPFVKTAQIETAPQQFTPSTYSIEPKQIPQPTIPYAVRPPQLPAMVEFNSTTFPYYTSATATVPLTANDVAPQSIDDVAQRAVTQFNELGTGSGTSAVLTGVTGYTAPINASTIELTDRGQLTFSMQSPLDPTLDTVRLYSYSVQSRKLREITTLSFNTQQAQTLPLTFTVDFDDDTYFVPRFVNSVANIEFVDGSTGSYSAFAYTNLAQTATTGKTLEAALNSVIQSVDLQSDPDIRTTKHNLGA